MTITDSPQQKDEHMNGWHWILTLQWKNSTGGSDTRTDTGVLTELKGTRADAFAYLLAQVQTRHRAPAGVAVMFFALEPNTV